MQREKKENDRYHTAYKIFRMLTDYFEDRVNMQKCYDIKNADFFQYHDTLRSTGQLSLQSTTQHVITDFVGEK